MAGRWEWVADGPIQVGVTTSRREHTTSTVVVSGDGALLVDPAWDPDELGWIADDLAAAGVTVTAGFATHAHHDHLLWHPRWAGADRWASSGTRDQATVRRSDLVDALGSGWPAELGALVGRVNAASGSRLPWNGTSIELITHDGHACGHTALWLPAAQVLIAGDMLSDVELPLLEESDPADYDAAMAALRPYVERARVIIPGHGTPAIGPEAATARWVADRRYLDALIADRDQDDHRMVHPGMRDAHQHNRSRVLT